MALGTDAITCISLIYFKSVILRQICKPFMTALLLSVINSATPVAWAQINQ